MSIIRLLVIAGSDSSGGAGVQADIKAAAALGAYAMTVITALTAQNMLGALEIYPVPLSFIRNQFEAVSKNISFDAIKIGMLDSSEIVRLISELLVGIKVPVVLDPVMLTKSGGRLLKADAIAIMKKELFPRIYLLTPNLDEAEFLLNRQIRNIKDMTEAAFSLVSLGVNSVLIKGGHLVEQPTDVFYDGNKLHIFTAPRINSNYTHGTGCTLATSCATLLAKGWDLKSAIERSRLLVRRAIIGGFSLGSGYGPVNAMFDLAPRINLKLCLSQMDKALAALAIIPKLGRLVPEVRSQLGYALPGAESIDEIIAVSGRITEIDGFMRAAGPLRLGVSTHIAKVILAALVYDQTKRAAIALRFSEKYIDCAYSLGWKVGEFRRSDEPSINKIREGATLSWGVKQIIISLDGKVPDFIFDRGEAQKEPIIRLLACDPQEIVRRVLLLVQKINSS